MANSSQNLTQEQSFEPRIPVSSRELVNGSRPEATSRRPCERTPSHADRLRQDRHRRLMVRMRRCLRFWMVSMARSPLARSRTEPTIRKGREVTCPTRTASAIRKIARNGIPSIADHSKDHRRVAQRVRFSRRGGRRSVSEVEGSWLGTEGLLVDQRHEDRSQVPREIRAAPRRTWDGFQQKSRNAD